VDVDKAQIVEMLRGRGDHELADRVNAELPARFDPAEQPLLADLDLRPDAGDAARHAGGGAREEMEGLPTAEDR
jgi:hypothetical protein